MFHVNLFKVHFTAQAGLLSLHNLLFSVTHHPTTSSPEPFTQELSSLCFLAELLAGWRYKQLVRLCEVLRCCFNLNSSILALKCTPSHLCRSVAYTVGEIFQSAYYSLHYVLSSFGF